MTRCIVSRLDKKQGIYYIVLKTTTSTSRVCQRDGINQKIFEMFLFCILTSASLKGCSPFIYFSNILDTYSEKVATSRTFFMSAQKILGAKDVYSSKLCFTKECRQSQTQRLARIQCQLCSLEKNPTRCNGE